MLLVVEFDITADIINVPEDVILNKDIYRTRFLKWLYATNNKYRTKITDSNGHTFWGIIFRSDAFVEWLNKKVLKNSTEKAEVIVTCTNEYSEDLPVIFF